jgi:hypothetical protein
MLQKIVFLLALSYSSLAQIHVLNEKNLQPIEGVEVYSDLGILLGLSDRLVLFIFLIFCMKARKAPHHKTFI